MFFTFVLSPPQVMNTPVSALLTSREKLVFTTPDTTVQAAARMMTEENTGSILIMTSGGDLIGIFTERDLLTRVVAQNLDPETAPIESVMSQDVVCVTSTALRKDVHQIMTIKHVRHVPVLRSGRVVGVISLRDILRSANAEKDFEINQLKDYVTNRPYPSYPG